MAKFKLPHSGHNKHLCYLVNLCFQQYQPAEYKKLVSSPKYMCKMCGRTAANPRNLCNPIKL